MNMEKLAWPLTIVSGILLVGVLLYMFGTPTAGPPGRGSAGVDVAQQSSAPVPDDGESADSMPPMGEVVEGEAPPPDPSTPLAIEIPGCVCHSDDADVVAEHEAYRMNQCAGCHMGGMHGG